VAVSLRNSVHLRKARTIKFTAKVVAQWMTCPTCTHEHTHTHMHAKMYTHTHTHIEKHTHKNNP